MRPHYLSLTMDAADRNGVSVAQTPTGAANLTITGALATGGVASMDVARHVSIYSDGNDSTATFTITGTDRDGVALTEDITGPSITTVKGLKNFLTVTQVAISKAGVGSIEVGSADEAESQLIPTDVYADELTYAVTLSSGASLTYNLLYTHDPVIDGSYDEHTATYFNDLGDKVVNANGASTGPVSAIRLRIKSFSSGTARLTILTARNA